MRLRAWAVTCGLLVSFAVAPPSSADPPKSEPGRTITLITGDQVVEHRIPGGHTYLPRAARGREHVQFVQYGIPGHHYVIPSDAAGLVASGKVDEQLFDVTQLVTQKQLRVIVQHGDEVTSLADARPLDWSSLNIRLRVRLLAASTGAHSEEVLASERAFLPTMLEAFELLLSRIHHRFTWSPALGVRVVILTYERSFESWIMSGRNEQSFAESSYIKHTLPELLLGMSAPSQT